MEHFEQAAWIRAVISRSAQQTSEIGGIRIWERCEGAALHSESRSYAERRLSASKGECCGAQEGPLRAVRESLVGCHWATLDAGTWRAAGAALIFRKQSSLLGAMQPTHRGPCPPCGSWPLSQTGQVRSFDVMYFASSKVATADLAYREERRHRAPSCLQAPNHSARLRTVPRQLLLPSRLVGWISRQTPNAESAIPWRPNLASRTLRMNDASTCPRWRQFARPWNPPMLR